MTRSDAGAADQDSIPRNGKRPRSVCSSFRPGWPECDARPFFFHFCKVTSHCFTVLSELAEARVLPSGLHDTLQTASVCPLRVVCSLAVATSQSFTVLSRPAEARVLLSGLHDTDQTVFVCPLRVASALPV